MKKAKENNSDPFLALLDFRNTPSENLGLSPVQILMGRRTRTKMPIADKLLSTPTASATKEALQKSKEKQRFYYDRTAKERPSFKEGQVVRAKYRPTDDYWRKAEIKDVLPFRSYNVRFENGNTMKRTSKHVRFSQEDPIRIDEEHHSYQPDSPDGARATALPSHAPQPPPAQPPPVQERSTKVQPEQAPTQKTNVIEPYRTRSGRAIMKPQRFG